MSNHIKINPIRTTFRKFHRDNPDNAIAVVETVKTHPWQYIVAIRHPMLSSLLTADDAAVLNRMAEADLAKGCEAGHLPPPTRLPEYCGGERWQAGYQTKENAEALAAKAMSMMRSNARDNGVELEVF